MDHDQKHQLTQPTSISSYFLFILGLHYENVLGNTCLNLRSGLTKRGTCDIYF